MRKTFILLCLLIVSTSFFSVNAGSEADSYVWWEGEKADDTNFLKRSWLSGDNYPDVRNQVFSEGEWLTYSGNLPEHKIYAKYNVDVPKSGEYNFWCRKFWKHGPFEWRFDKEDFQTCGKDVALADSVSVAKYIAVNWVNLGKVKLSRGKHTFELQLVGKEGEEVSACFDCFMLTSTVFTPRGKYKPGEKSGLAEEGYWAFEPSADSFEKTPLDLRYLNEKEAGKTGFIKKKNGEFTLGDGKEVRFWGVNVGGSVVNFDEFSQKYLARKLAKMGVNIVRVHSKVFDESAKDPAQVNIKYLDNLHRFINILKNEGIYVNLSIYFPLWFDVKPGYGIDGYDKIKNKKPFGLLFFNSRMQEIYRSWVKALFTTKSPYTKKTLAEEPAVAMFEILNEDSYFFWTFSAANIPEMQMRILEKIYGEWLIKKYGKLEKAFEAWEKFSQPRDDAGKGTAQLLEAWHMTEKGIGQGGHRKRMIDQVQFLTENQRKFYTDTVEYIRKELKAQSLIVASNWKTADARILDPLEKYTYTGADIIDKHGYFGGKHNGDGSAYSVRRGHTFKDRSGLEQPESTLVQYNSVKDYPSIISELNYPNPNRFKAEFPLMCAAYGSLQNIDGFFFFAIGSPSWDATITKFSVANPSGLGQFPAFALAYRLGYIKEGKTVVEETHNLGDLYNFKGSSITSAQNYDDLRKVHGVDSEEVKSKIDPLSFFVGKVEQEFSSKGSSMLKTENLKKFIDRENKVITSNTKEIVWNYKNGLITLNTPKCQGCTGYLSEGKSIELDDVVIESKNFYGTVVVVALDGKDLSKSKQILVQAMTEDKYYGWRVAGDTIEALGGYPINVRNIEITINFKNRKLSKATVLDENGYKKDKIRLKSEKGTKSLTLAEDSIYTIVE